VSRALLVVVALSLVFASSASAAPFGAPVAPRLSAALPGGFTESTVWSGLGNPTVLRFAGDGRAFVATKAGRIYEFDGVDDPTPTLFADLSAEVQDFWDRGLLGMALAPDGGDVYVLYSHDEPEFGDNCPDSGTLDGCRIDNRLSRLDASGRETVLLEDYCQQFPSHSAGTLAFGPDGMLYVSAGEGAHFDYADFGQIHNACQDPPKPDGAIGPPDAQGGALRAQAFRRPAGQPLSPDGSLLRLDPTHPVITRSSFVAYGFRNPFRFTFRPDKPEIWLGDVGWTTWEEIDQVPVDGTVRNYGWPCYEGAAKQDAYDALDVTTCESLYAAGTATAPRFAYRHDGPVVAGDGCTPGDSSISGLSFYGGTAFPAKYRGALFFADYARDCLWVMYPDAQGEPDPATRELFAGDATSPVFVTDGPDGALYYADINEGAVRRIGYAEPIAKIAANPATGPAPLTVSFDGRGSSDPQGHALAYAWDLDGDGAFDDSTSSTPSHTYTQPGEHQVRLEVTGTGGSRGRATTTIEVGQPPTVTITAPTAATTWAVGDRIDFAGTTSAGTLKWSLVLRHCSRVDTSECHSHQLLNATGASGSFVAPDHDYPSYLELTAGATSGGLTRTKTVRLNPRTGDLTLASDPPGLSLALGSEVEPTPFTLRFLAGSAVGVGAPLEQTLDSVPYAWTAWSDGFGRAHTVTVPDGGTATYTAAYAGPSPEPTATATRTATPTPLPSASPAPTATPTATPEPAPRPVAEWGFDEPSGAKVARGTLAGPLRVRGGRFGNALDFDGVDDWVTVKAPKLTDAMTVELWAYPTRHGGSLALHETARGEAWALYEDEGLVGRHFIRGARLPLRRWTHLAMTYDGRVLRRYVDGALVGATRRTGAVPASTYPLRFGGNAVWKEWFKGRLDEVRVYDSALTPARIQADMRTPIHSRVTKARAAKRVKGGANVKKFRGKPKGARPL
jgi:glucose/arabinose dehydrogenase/PKD repeat protein